MYDITDRAADEWERLNASDPEPEEVVYEVRDSSIRNLPLVFSTRSEDKLELWLEDNEDETNPDRWWVCCY